VAKGRYYAVVSFIHAAGTIAGIKEADFSSF